MRKGFGYAEILFLTFLAGVVALVIGGVYAELNAVNSAKNDTRLLYFLSSEVNRLRDVCSKNPTYSATLTYQITPAHSVEVDEECRKVNGIVEITVRSGNVERKGYVLP